MSGIEGVLAMTGRPVIWLAVIVPTTGFQKPFDPLGLTRPPLASSIGMLEVGLPISASPGSLERSFHGPTGPPLDIMITALDGDAPTAEQIDVPPVGVQEIPVR
jgi:hypothetical protein